MDGTKPFLERRCSHGSCGHQIGACFNICAIGIGFGQIFKHKTDAFNRNAVSHRMKARCAIGFQTMCQCIHTGSNCDEGRHTSRKLWIGNDRYRQHFRVENDFLGMGRFIGQHTGTSNFRAGASCCRYGDNRCNRIAVGPCPPVANVFKIPDIAGLACLKSDELAQIKRRASTKSNHAVMLAVFENLHTSIKIAFNWIGLHIGEDCIFDASSIKNGECGSDDREFCKTGIGNEQWAFDTGCFENCRQFLDATWPEKHGCREIPFGS